MKLFNGMNKIVILISFAIIIASCGTSGSEATSASKEAETAVATDTIAVDSTKVDAVSSATSKPNEVLFNGIITESPQHHATVAVTMGGTVNSTSLLPGQYVGKGSVIVTLKNPEFIALQQTYLESYAQAEYLKIEYERQQALNEERAVSQKNYQAGKAAYLSNESKLQSAAAQLQLLGVAPSLIVKSGIQQLLQVKAPVSGYISGVTINIGKYVQPGEPICEIIDKSNLLLSLTTYEKDVTKMRVGAKIEFRVNGIPDKLFKAAIISVGQNIDRLNRATEVYARIIDKDPQFLSGMYVNARIVK
jgi:membrane fusion protein, heavy metal efflux system